MCIALVQYDYTCACTIYLIIFSIVSFCVIIDRGFDNLNSQSRFRKAYRSAVIADNLHNPIHKHREFTSCLLSIKTPAGTTLVNSDRKTVFINFITTLKSVFDLAADIIPHYSYFLTFRLSQDHIGTLSKVRRMEDLTAIHQLHIISSELPR